MTATSHWSVPYHIFLFDSRLEIRAEIYTLALLKKRPFFRNLLVVITSL
jgi:hypothetical protein